MSILTPDTTGMRYPGFIPRIRILLEKAQKLTDKLLGSDKADNSKLPDFLRPDNK